MLKLVLLFFVISFGKDLNVEITSRWISQKNKEQVVIQNYKIPMEEYWTLPFQNDGI
jgi:hypothetical protein